MSNTQKLIDAISLGNEEDQKNAFSSAMQDKVRSAINVKTIETAEQIYNAPKAETVTESKELEEDQELSEAKIEVPTDEKDMKAFLNNAKKVRASSRDFVNSMKSLDLNAFTRLDKHARNHKDFNTAYELGYNVGTGGEETLPKPGGLEGNNPHRKNTYAYHLWMDMAGQGMADS